MKRPIACLVGILCVSAAVAADWKQFRGPTADGTASSAPNVATSWSDGSNVVWRTALPGLGTSSPITLGNSIYLTCYSGYGLQPNKDKQEDLMRHLVCLDRKSGKMLWKKDFAPALPESTYSGGTSSLHGYSSSTPTTDGTHLYVQFGKSGLYCLTLKGEEVWHAKLGDRTHKWGSANSPVLFKDLVIVNASVESGELIAFNKKTGDEVWRASGMRSSWNTPHIVTLDNGAYELVVSVQRKILAFDPNSGKKLWDCEGIPTYVCPTVISKDGIVYATGGRGKQFMIAVRAGGRGDVTDSHVLWRTPKGSNVSSPVYHDGHIYCANDSKGIAFCFDAKTGEVKYEARLTPRPGRIYSSPIIANGNIYYVSQNKGAFVVKAKPEFELVSHNSFGDDDSRSNSCPVVDGNRILLRNDNYLYCLGSE